ncbi:MAG: YkgJ family cysteine cluster protein [Caldimicrobium sp.]|jgi:Fe-S-cluster containining protein|uniref:YkgJ family cysteine cluster protein n=1 Tax=Caldimicrobium thiodismutans TaxID=1653476 RepID=A0A2N7PIF7_9BACT|nr:MAG: YkgJ family cysteine cluster protein [Caldimicrobium thiodismutans]
MSEIHRAKGFEKIVEPIRLSPQSKITFQCYPGVPCFKLCCSDLYLPLTPYDILRLRDFLKLTTDEFLVLYTEPFILPKSGLPIARLKMREDEEKTCTFLGEGGCTVYEVRPLACRYYPLGFGLFRNRDERRNEEFYYLVKEGFCQGLESGEVMTVEEYRKSQGIPGLEEPIVEWAEIIMKKESLGPIEVPEKSLELFFMVSTNPERFRSFVFESRFLEIFEVDDKVLKEIEKDDLKLLQFGFKWLKTILFGENLIKKRKESPAIKKAKPF